MLTIVVVAAIVVGGVCGRGRCRPQIRRGGDTTINNYVTFYGDVSVSTSDTTLDLSQQNYTGTIPIQQIIMLTSLNVINLGGNLYTGSIPTELFLLQNLTMILLHDNLLTGQLPQELSSLIILETLDLSNNSLSGPLDTIFPLPTGQRRQLDGVDVDNIFNNTNENNSTTPSPLASLGQLKALLLHKNQFTGTIPPGIKDLYALGMFLTDSPFCVCLSLSRCPLNPPLYFLVIEWNSGSSTATQRFVWCHPW